MPNPNLFRRIYDAQQRIALRVYLKVLYITPFVGRIFCCYTGKQKNLTDETETINTIK